MAETFQGKQINQSMSVAKKREVALELGRRQTVYHCRRPVPALFFSSLVLVKIYIGAWEADRGGIIAPPSPPRCTPISTAIPFLGRKHGDAQRQRGDAPRQRGD